MGRGAGGGWALSEVNGTYGDGGEMRMEFCLIRLWFYKIQRMSRYGNQMQLDAIIDYRYILTLYLSKFANENRIIFRMWPFGAAPRQTPCSWHCNSPCRQRRWNCRLRWFRAVGRRLGPVFGQPMLFPFPKEGAFQVQNWDISSAWMSWIAWIFFTS